MTDVSNFHDDRSIPSRFNSRGELKILQLKITNRAELKTFWLFIFR